MHAETGDPLAVDTRRTLAKVRRLRRPREFAAVLAAGRGSSVRATGEWLSVTAAWFGAAPPRARIGITVSKRMAHRATDRALVKRIVREAFRASAAGLEHQAAAARVRVDISIRMKRPIATPGDPKRPPLAVWRRALRADVDQLLVVVATRLATVDADA